MKEMVRACLSVQQALGGTQRILGLEEQEQAPKMRRSLVAKTTLHIGQAIDEGNVEFKRPGDGIPPNKLFDFVGKKIVNKIEAGDLITESDLL
jgi:N-acetylneuraminate synthase